MPEFWNFGKPLSFVSGFKRRGHPVICAGGRFGASGGLVKSVLDGDSLTGQVAMCKTWLE